MTVSLAPYRVSSGEKPVASAKQNGLITSLENAFNAFPANQLVGYPNDATRFLGGSGNWSPLTTRGVATVYAKTTTTDVVNTSAQTDLFDGAFTLPINSLSSTGGIKIWAGGDYFQTGSLYRPALYLQYSNTMLWQYAQAGSGPDCISGAAARHAWHFEAVIQGLGGSGTSWNVYASGRFNLSAPSDSLTGTGSVSEPKYSSLVQRMLRGAFLSASVPIVMTAAQPLRLYVRHFIASPNLSMRCFWARVEVMY